MKVSVEDRAQDLLERFSVETAVQDPCVSYLSKVSIGDLHKKIFVIKDLKIRSLFKLCKKPRALGKILPAEL